MERFAQVQSIADEYVRSVSAEIVRLDGNGLPVIDHQKLTAKRIGNMSFSVFWNLSGSLPPWSRTLPLS